MRGRWIECLKRRPPCCAWKGTETDRTPRNLGRFSEPTARFTGSTRFCSWLVSRTLAVALSAARSCAKPVYAVQDGPPGALPTSRLPACDPAGWPVVGQALGDGWLLGPASGRDSAGWRGLCLMLGVKSFRRCGKVRAVPSTSAADGSALNSACVLCSWPPPRSSKQ